MYSYSLSCTKHEALFILLDSQINKASGVLLKWLQEGPPLRD